MALRTRIRLVAALVLAVASLPLASSLHPASAATVSVTYTCKSTVFDVDVVDGLQSLQVSVEAPSEIGGSPTFDVPVAIEGGPRNFGFEVTDAKLTAQLSLAIYRQGGGLVTTPTAIGAETAAATLAPSVPLPLQWPTSVMASTSGFESGDVAEFRPGTLVVTYTAGSGGVAGTSVTCTPDDPTTVIARADVTESSDGCVNGPRCGVAQRLNPAVVGTVDGLTLNGINNGTTFGAVQTEPNDQQLSAALDDIQVQDVRGGELGWSMTAFTSDELTGAVSADHTIPVGNLSLSVGCSAVTTDADGDTVDPPEADSTCDVAAGGALTGLGSSSSIALASSPTSTGGTGGTWSISLDADLTVPAYQPADDYSMVLTVVLTSD